MLRHILALDVGTRRTGAAFCPDGIVPVALEPMEHENQEQLLLAVLERIEERGVDAVILGLPLLPSGEEGSQCSAVRSIGGKLTERGVPVSYLDERFTTSLPAGMQDIDADSSAACQILLTWLERKDLANN